jgi:hypothetical protein
MCPTRAGRSMKVSLHHGPCRDATKHNFRSHIFRHEFVSTIVVGVILDVMTINHDALVMMMTVLI